MITSSAFSHFDGRRAAQAVLAVLVAVVAMTSAFSTAQADDRAVKYMRRAAAALINAQRQRSEAGFARVVKKYGHVPAIGMYALGSYSRGLVHSDRRSYYRGLAKFIGRYAAKESPKYPVARVKFARTSIRDGRSVLVDSQVIMRDGTTYDVRWLLVPNRKSFRVRDAQVLSSIWVSPFLKNLFENYIAENGGRVKNLVIALNR